MFSSTLTLAVGIAVSGAFFGGLIAYLYLRRNMKKYKADLNLEKEYEKDKISDKDIYKEIIKYAVPFIIINIVNNIYSFTDMVLILRALNHLGFSASDVEFITSIISTWGSKIGMIVNSIASGMTVSLIPIIVECYAVKNWKGLNDNLNKALQMVIFISLPMVIGLSILATPVWTLFYNTNPYGGMVLKVLIINTLVGNIHMIVNATLQSCNRFKLVYLNNIIGLGINALLDVPLMLLCHKLGVGAYYGAIISSFIGYSISTYISLHFIQKEDGFKLNYKDTIITVLKNLVPAFVMLVVLLVLNRFLPFDVYSKGASVILVIIDALVGACIYLGISYKMGIIDYIFGREYIIKLIKKLTKGKLLKN